MIIGSQVQEDVNAAFLAKWDGGAGDQGYLIGLSCVLHAVTNLLVADVLPKFAGKGNRSDAISMEYVAQLFIQSVGVGMNLKETHEEGYDQALAMAMRNLHEMWVAEDESE